MIELKLKLIVEWVKLYSKMANTIITVSISSENGVTRILSLKPILCRDM